VLDLPRHARLLLPGLDNQGLGLSRSQFPEAHHYRRRHRQLPQRAGLVLGVQLAADLGRCAATVIDILSAEVPEVQPHRFREAIQLQNPIDLSLNFGPVG
jgi:hypothetical protein